MVEHASMCCIAIEQRQQGNGIAQDPRGFEIEGTPWGANYSNLRGIAPRWRLLGPLSSACAARRRHFALQQRLRTRSARLGGHTGVRARLRGLAMAPTSYAPN